MVDKANGDATLPSKLRPSLIGKAINSWMDARRPVMIWGPPGV